MVGKGTLILSPKLEMIGKRNTNIEPKMHCTSIILLTAGPYLAGQMVLNLRQHTAFYKFLISVDCHNAADMKGPITPCAQMPAQSVNPEILSWSPITRCGISPLQKALMCRFTLSFFLEVLFNCLWHLLCVPRISFVSNRKPHIEFHLCTRITIFRNINTLFYYIRVSSDLAELVLPSCDKSANLRVS